jgi:hypothetical protein
VIVLIIPREHCNRDCVASKTKRNDHSSTLGPPAA